MRYFACWVEVRLHQVVVDTSHPCTHPGAQGNAEALALKVDGNGLMHGCRSGCLRGGIDAERDGAVDDHVSGEGGYASDHCGSGGPDPGDGGGDALRELAHQPDEPSQQASNTKCGEAENRAEDRDEALEEVGPVDLLDFLLHRVGIVQDGLPDLLEDLRRFPGLLKDVVLAPAVPDHLGRTAGLARPRGGHGLNAAVHRPQLVHELVTGLDPPVAKGADLRVVEFGHGVRVLTGRVALVWATHGSMSGR
ncbi:hypothetical protein [Streptomyces kaempferi]|uniref:hypothetical protein n=1 Tax=Streptomyces kaempferi TaxID=333725 RepID=UPI003606E4F6